MDTSNTPDTTDQPASEQELLLLIREQGEELLQLRSEVDRLRAHLESPNVRDPCEPIERDQPVGAARRTRRDVLRLTGAAGIAGAVAGSTLAHQPAAAADNDPLLAGNEVISTSYTSVRAGGGSFTGRNVFTAADGSTGSSFPSALAGFAYGNHIENGVYAYAASRDNTNTVTGHALVAWATSGARSNLYLVASRPTPPTSDAFLHSMNEVLTDVGGNLYHCVDSGTPGTWRRLSGPATAGALTAIDPARVYDGRKDNGPTPTGPLASGASRTIPVKDGRHPETNGVITPDLVPSGANAVAYNLTITEMTGSGFLSVSPGDGTAGASIINWGSSTSGAVANASIVKLDSNRQIKVFAGGGGTTKFIIDIVGFYL